MDALYARESLQVAALHAVRGIEGLRVSISEVDSTAADFGMSRRDLTNFIFGMLRLAGVPVVAGEEAPTLHAAVMARRVADLYSVSLEVELWDRVWLARQSHGEEAIRAATWRRGGSLVSNRHELRDNIRMELGNLVTCFLNDYMAANRAAG